MIGIVFSADSHLNRHYARMTPEQLRVRRDRLRSAWRQTVDFALAEGADVYLHGGDLFDGPNPRAVELVWAAAQFRRLADAGIETLLLAGNHDVPRTRGHDAAPQRLFAEVRLARVFSDPSAVTWHVIERRGVRLAVGGLPPDPRLPAGEDPLLRVASTLSPPPADAAILVTHYAVEGLGHPLADEPTIGRAAIASLSGKIDAVLAGHLHAGGQTSVSNVPVLFSGPTERMTFGEIDVRCGFLWISVDPGRTPRLSVRHVPLDPQPMRREIVPSASIPTNEPTEWLIARVRAWSAPEQILQVRLQGSLRRDTYQAVRFADVWRAGADANFYFDLDRHRLSVTVPDVGAPPGPATAVSPRAEIARVAGAMRDEAPDPAARETIEEACRLVLSMYGAGDVEEDGA